MTDRERRDRGLEDEPLSREEMENARDDDQDRSFLADVPPAEVEPEVEGGPQAEGRPDADERPEPGLVDDARDPESDD